MSTECFRIVVGLCPAIAGLLLTGAMADAAAGETIRIACVGDSITWGSGISQRESDAYPAQLQQSLGQGYIVRNFGVPGATLLEKGDRPYRDQEMFPASLEFAPDVVLLMLGTNDSKQGNFRFVDQFETDLESLVDSYSELPCKPQVVLLLPIPAFTSGNGINEKRLAQKIRPAIGRVAFQRDLQVIDLVSPLIDQSELLPDRVHPNAAGAEIISDRIGLWLSQDRVEFDILKSLPKIERKKAFHGYREYGFEHNGVGCTVVVPNRPATGLPWIWRARFFGHQPQLDIALLEQGFHLAYTDVANLYGSPKAIARWDRFYDLMVQAGLSKRPVLEGMSRGGLIIFNWAAKRPQQVAAIYGDAPVADFNSWPGSEKTIAKSPQNWTTLLKAYDFDSQEAARRWRGNPVDHAQVFAQAQIPIFNVVGQADEVVPVSENHDVLAKRIKAAGGKIEVIRKSGIGHHPHSLKNPKPIFEFILKATGHTEDSRNHSRLAPQEGERFEQE